MFWDRLPSIDDLGFDLYRSFEFAKNLDECSDLVETVLPFLDRAEIEIKIDLPTAVGDPQRDLMPLVRVFAADVFFASVFDDSDDVSPQVAELVEELASLNVISCSFSFLKLLLKVIGFGSDATSAN